jgi:hypothetical protein
VVSYLKVMLTKANLANQFGMIVTNVSFVTKGSQEKPSFFDCPFALLIFRVIYFTFKISSPSNSKSIFGNWLMELIRNLRHKFVWECL